MAVKHQKIACPQASLNRMCLLLGKSKQAYYKQVKAVPKLVLKAEKKEEIVQRVKYIKKKLPMIGGRKLHYMLARKKIPVGRDTLFTILRKNQLLVVKKRKYARTTQSNHWLKKHTDIFNTVSIERPEQAVVGQFEI